MPVRWSVAQSLVRDASVYIEKSVGFFWRGMWIVDGATKDIQCFKSLSGVYIL